MILLDFSGSIFSALHADLKDGDAPNINYIRHLCLNSIRYYNHRFRHEYGEMLICYDSKSWRQQQFSNYKWVRRQGRNEESKLDWKAIWEMFSTIQQEITDHLTIPTIQASMAEADDIIGLLCDNPAEKILIISNDKDMVSLTNNKLVTQFRPFNKSFYSVDDPIRFEFELIITGDKDDGVPSIKCADSFLRRQYILKSNGRKPPRAPTIRQTFKDELWVAYNDGTLRDKLDELGLTKRYLRNRTLISLDCIPDNVVRNIKTSFKNIKHNSMGDFLKLIREHKMNLLGTKLDDFKLMKLKPSIF